MRRFVRDNSMSIVFLVLFLAALVGQAIAGHADFNNNAQSHGDPTMSLGRYVLSSDFGSAVMENWQSEYLQFTLFILLTVWLVQRGSPESKRLDEAGRESDQAQKVGPHAQQNSPRFAKVAGHPAHALRELARACDGHVLAGHVACPVHHRSRAVQRGPARPPSGAAELVGTTSRAPSFWENTLQNWQSEFLAVGSMAILAVYLRQRGSPESKPVGAPHDATGLEG